MNGLYPGPATAPGWKLREREAGRAGLRDSGRAEVRRALEVDDRLPELVLVGCRRLERHGLHGLRVADREVAELGRVVDAKVVRDPLVRGVEQDVPDLLLVRRALVRDALVERQAHRLVAQVHLDRALLGQVVARQKTADRPEALRGGGAVLRAGDGNACCHRSGGDDQQRCSEQAALRKHIHMSSPLVPATPGSNGSTVGEARSAPPQREVSREPSERSVTNCAG